MDIFHYVLIYKYLYPSLFGKLQGPGGIYRYFLRGPEQRGLEGIFGQQKALYKKQKLN